MSQTIPVSGPTDTPQEKVRAYLDDWGRVAVSLIILFTYLGAHFIGWRVGGNTLDIVIGADINLAGVVATYWVGSSSGSQKKDDTIARLTVPSSASPPQRPI
jgi:hypothetical protein